MRSLPSPFLWMTIFLVLVSCPRQATWAQVEQAKPTNATEIELVRKQVVEKGLAFLATKGQAKNGSFTERAGAGITALAITAALRNGKSIDDPMVSKGLKALETFVKPDGGIYGGGRLKNYETCVAMMAFAEANQGGRYTQKLADVKAFLISLQNGDEPRDASDPEYGGVGYGGTGRPDSSNIAVCKMA